MRVKQSFVNPALPKLRYACDHVRAGAEVNTSFENGDSVMDLCHHCAQRQERLCPTDDGQLIFKEVYD